MDLSGAWIMTEHCESSEIGVAYSVTQDECDLTVESDQTHEVWDAQITGDGAIQYKVTVDGTEADCSGPATPTAIVWECETLDCSGRLERAD